MSASEVHTGCGAWGLLGTECSARGVLALSSLRPVGGRTTFRRDDPALVAAAGARRAAPSLHDKQVEKPFDYFKTLFINPVKCDARAPLRFLAVPDGACAWRDSVAFFCSRVPAPLAPCPLARSLLAPWPSSARPTRTSRSLSSSFTRRRSRRSAPGCRQTTVRARTSRRSSRTSATSAASRGTVCC